MDAKQLPGKYDDSNPLVYIPKPKKEEKKKPKVQPAKILSKSKRKLLQKQVEKKQKKLTVCLRCLVDFLEK